ncbi:MAG TPA: filamentous hemagglutinin family protein [Steroidobacteraceae bacterium]|nr:filamentous hemagglutinin family protein [Steroidobacteraceae bacterium]
MTPPASSFRTNPGRTAPRTVAQAVARILALAAAQAASHAAWGAGPQLPVPCYSGSCAPAANKATGASFPGFGSSPAGFVTSGSATATQSGNTLKVTQSSAQAILNWSSFNIGAGGQVIFQQPSSTAIALNKIYQSSPSSIFGALTANGQVYLINPNGFVFGKTAVVNVGGLMASSLGLYTQGNSGTDTELSNGLLTNAANGWPALTSDGRVYVTDASGNAVLDANGNPQQVEVQVQPGAAITAADGGRILLAGQVVDNAGTLTAPDGQIVLAAGQSVYLESSSDPSLVGLLVEVNNSAIATSDTGSAAPIASGNVLPSGAAAPAPATAVGTLTNEAAAQLSTPRGNISLMGLAVNQAGRLSATTSVTQDGSVILEAGQGQAEFSGCSSDNSCTTEGGTLTLASTSDIEVLPDTTSAPGAVGLAQEPSTIDLTGQAVYLDGGTINAPGGNLNVLAAANPSEGVQSLGNSAAQIRVNAGTSIDLAGSDATLPMSANLLTLQLLGNELEDDPDQRSGALHGDTIVVDVRDGKPPIISDSSWSSALQAIDETIQQRTAAGGNASFTSEGDVVVANGASINVSGGAWTYQPGITQTSELIGANGQNYNIETASPLNTYTGVLNPTYTQSYSGFGVQVTGTTPGLAQSNPGYVQGFSAGTVTLAAPAVLMQGTLTGTAVNGMYQRSPASIPAESLAVFVANGGAELSDAETSAIAMAQGGTLDIGLAGTSSTPPIYGPSVNFGQSSTSLVVADGTPLLPQPMNLSLSYLTSGGFQHTNIVSSSTVTLPSGLPLELGAGGSLAVQAPRIDIDSSIQAPDGTIDLTSISTPEFTATGARPGIDVAAGVSLDVSGLWTNDEALASPMAFTATYEDGGGIALTLAAAGGELTLGSGVSLLADGGAWLDAAGSLSGGMGGGISIDASPYQSGLAVGSDVTLAAYGVQGAQGGSFSLAVPRLAVTNGAWSGAQSFDDLASPGGVFTLGAGIFSQYGFSSVSVTASAPEPVNATINNVLTVESGTAIDGEAQTLELGSGYTTRPTGGTAEGLGQPQLLPVAEQSPFAISFTAAPVITDPANAEVPGAATAAGDIDIQQGASIYAGPGGTSGSKITLSSNGSILIDGAIIAPGGSITAELPSQTQLFNDPGYLTGQRIELGPQSVLNVAGTLVPTLNNMDLALGTVLSGGSISLLADRGEVIADGAPAGCGTGAGCAQGARMDLAGGSALLDEVDSSAPGGYLLTTVGSAGGSLTVQSVESVSLLGTIDLSAGASSNGTVEGGSLSLTLTPFSGQGPNGEPTPYSAAPFTIDVLPSIPAGAQPLASDSNTAILGLAQIQGLGSLSLNAGQPLSTGVVGTIDLQAANISAGEQISLNAPTIAVGNGQSVTLSAPYVAITDTQQVQPSQQPSAQAAGGLTAGAISGTGSLTVNAQEIALSGYNWLQGVQNVTLNASGDVQLDPLPNYFLSGTGALVVPGGLTISATRVYPATLADYAIDAGGDVTITPALGPSGQPGANPATPQVPLSVGGALTINAPDIASSGTLLAPFGDITLAATNSLSLLSGSLTSVSADGATLPFGQTTLGQQEWVYLTGGGSLAISGIGSLNPQAGAPSRTVTLTGGKVTLAGGATVDVSGGGDLTAYEWVPGLGGSTDALGQAANSTSSGLYAVVPSLAGQYAAYDLQEFGGSNASVGQSVYLSGIPGLPAGFYPLLPARYALLPGAFLIQAEPSFSSESTGTLGALADGTPVVAGYFSFGGGSSASQGVRAASGYEGFAVWPGSYGQQLASYDTTTATAFFTAAAASLASSGSEAGTGPGALAAAQEGLAAATTTPPLILPADAGTLALGVGSSLDLSEQSHVDTAAGSDGTAATVDIYPTGASAGSSLTVAPGASSAGGIIVDAAALQAWDPGTLVLGGDLSDDAIAVTAGSVNFAAGTHLTAGQILAVANDSINVESGADIGSNPAASAAGALPLQFLTLTDNGATDNDAALFALSNSALPVVVRSAPADANAATVSVAGGATLASQGAVALDAPGAVAIADSVTLDTAGASWSLASNSIGFVASRLSPPPPGASPDTLLIDPWLVSQLDTAGSLRLSSAGSIDLDTSVSLGGAQMQSLALSGSALNNLSPASSFSAQTLVLLGVGSGVTPPDPATTPASQTLAFSGGEIDFGGTGVLSINNVAPVASTMFTASGPMVGLGPGGLAVNGGNVSVQAAELTATSGSTAQLTVPTGTLNIAADGAPVADTSLTSSLGGGLALSAQAITDTGAIIIPGGRAALAATAGDLTLGAGALIDVSGITVTAVDVTKGAAGGIVDLSASGNLALEAGSRIAVEGALGTPDGSLSLSAGDNVALGATLDGGAVTDSAGGTFSLYAGGQLAGGLAPLAAQLGGFTNIIELEVGQGNLDLPTGSALTANQVVLSADSGSIDIAGSIGAPSGDLRGSIGLFAQGPVTLESAGTLMAQGEGGLGAASRGGSIELSTVGGSIVLDPSQAGAGIFLGGTTEDGTLLLRAPTMNGNDVAISAIDTSLTGVGQIIVEPVLQASDYAAVGASVPTGDFTANFTPIQSAVENYYSAASTVIPGRLATGSAASVPMLIEPGVVIDESGDTTLSSSLDLAQQLNGIPIDLTVRSTGELNIDGDISDGEQNNVLTNTPSSSLRFVAGANLASANPLGVLPAGLLPPGTAADLTLGTLSATAKSGGAIVQTGTGDIDLVASGNVVIDPYSSAYTTGVTPANLGATEDPNGTGPITYATGGGNVVVSAGADIIGTPVAGSVADWQARDDANSAFVGVWGVNLADFDKNPWSFATFGGGDVSLTASGNVTTVTAAAADSQNYTGTTQLYASGGLVVSAGRNITAGGNITAGQFFLADGTGSLSAGQSFDTVPSSSGTGPGVLPVGSLFDIQNSQISLWAEDDINISGIIDPTTLFQAAAKSPVNNLAFLSYGATSGLSAQSTAGTVTISDISTDIAQLIGSTASRDASTGVLDILAPSLALTALTQDVDLSALIGTLAPSAQGQLSLFAGLDIIGSQPSLSLTGSLAMSDAPAAVLSTAADASAGRTGVTLTGYSFYGDLHAGQNQPASIIAGRDIDGLTLTIPMASDIESGRDIVDLTYTGQNLSPTDTTLIYAGRNFSDPIQFGVGGVPEQSYEAVTVGGPGALDIIAGGSIDLGFSNGVTTVGNLLNANLPYSTGADLTMMAGLGQPADDSNFLQQIIEPSATYQQQLVAYVEGLNGQSGLSASQADADFLALGTVEQNPFIDDVFFNELNQSGIEATTVANAGYQRGYAAIEALFPGTPTTVGGTSSNLYAGDLDLTYSQIYTEDGGNISLLAPGGSINVGLANPPASSASAPKQPYQLGIVAQGSGNVDIYSLGDVNVNSSRIFTLGGGNILIWSQLGSIDAGNGAKTSLSLPPPVITINPSTGLPQVTFDAAVAGSGIRTIQSAPDVPAGNVDLIAPVGTVNAGDAGIGAAGNINIAAESVVGASNINFGGTATGVPAAVSNVTASVSGAATAGAASTSTQAQADQGSAAQKPAASQSEAALQWLDVFVTGLGEDNCSPSDTECLKKQQSH